MKSMNAELKLGDIEKQLQSATEFSQWRALALQYDKLSGAEDWKAIDQSSLYDYQEVLSRKKRLRSFLEHQSYRELLYALNEGVHGNMGGMGHPILYSQAKYGTKQLIDEYVLTIAEALKCIADCPESIIGYAEKLDFFRRASHCYGRSALLLSGGVGLIYFHHGVVQELVAQDLLPNVISGASSGAIVATLLGIHTDDELKAGLLENKRWVEPTQTSLLDAALGKLSKETLRQVRERFLDEFVAMDLTFQEAFELTGRYINISISPAEKHQTSRLMNAITSPHVYVRSAVSASFSVPGVVPSERLFAKGYDGKPRPYLSSRRWVDGSVSGDLPTRRLSRLYGVNHFLVSLINPYVVPFVEDTKSRQRKGFKSTLSRSSVNVFSEALVVMEKMLVRAGVSGSNLSNQIAYLIRILEQDYLGDINMLLRTRDFRWRNVLFDYRDGDIERMLLAGKRATWPRIPMIKNAALISRTLDNILEQLNQKPLNQDNGHKHHIYS